MARKPTRRSGRRRASTPSQVSSSAPPQKASSGHQAAAVRTPTAAIASNTASKARLQASIRLSGPRRFFGAAWSVTGRGKLPARSARRDVRALAAATAHTSAPNTASNRPASASRRSRRDQRASPCASDVAALTSPHNERSRPRATARDRGLQLAHRRQRASGAHQLAEVVDVHFGSAAEAFDRRFEAHGLEARAARLADLVGFDHAADAAAGGHHGAVGAHLAHVARHHHEPANEASE